MNELTQEQKEKRDRAVAMAHPDVKKAMKNPEVLSFINALFSLEE